jgi:hypothetical protein
MNKRIEELLKQSDGLVINKMMTGRKQYVFLEDDFIKFTELIVHDCVKIAELKEQGYNEYESDVSVGWYIKEHFGIK